MKTNAKGAGERGGTSLSNAEGETASQIRLEVPPETVVTGHGQAMRGTQMRAALDELAARFDDIAVPDHGRYVLRSGSAN
jgi:hypothetical protein